MLVIMVDTACEMVDNLAVTIIQFGDLELDLYF